MKILIVNDDGIDAVGINVLAEAFCKDNDIYMVAPSEQRSAFSHSISVFKPLDIVAHKTDLPVKACYSCSGTPADCVKFAVLHLMKKDLPDLIISGINSGGNLGSDIMYSGTVSAAFEGAYLGIRSIAISASDYRTQEKMYRKAAKFLKENLSSILALDMPSETVLNVNYPTDVPYKGVKATKAGVRYYFDTFVESEKPGSYSLEGWPKDETYNDHDCDVEWIKKGYATVTPLHLDRNNYEVLKRIRDGHGLK